jgi:UDP-N-acetylmuramoylalanine--D-glutamate ligase
LDILPQARMAKVIVLEVSSYQLETAPGFHPHVAVLLNITPDHLDRYGDMGRYIQAKALLFRNQTAKDVCIYNIGDPEVAKLATASKARNLPFSAQEPGLPYRLSDTRLTGAHNFENMIAAILAVQAVGLPDDAIRRGLKTFQGLPHRLQFVRELRGVTYYDDSKGTNIGAVVKSLAGFSRPIHLIAGGLGKGTRYTGLRPAVAAHVRTLILMGADRGIMREDLGDLATTILVDSMKEAVATAFGVARTGDVVLLSPACASFDMFKDYADRGSQFCKHVEELAA